MTNIRNARGNLISVRNQELLTKRRSCSLLCRHFLAAVYFVPLVAGYIRRGSDTRANLPLSRLSGPIYIPNSGSRECRSAATNVHREPSGLVVVIRFRHPSASYRWLACRRCCCRDCRTRLDFVAAAMQSSSRSVFSSSAM